MAREKFLLVSNAGFTKWVVSRRRIKDYDIVLLLYHDLRTDDDSLRTDDDVCVIYVHHDRGTDGVTVETKPHLDGGHIILSATPSTKFLHTGPYVRLSIDLQ